MDPVTADDVLAETANAIHSRDLLRAAAEFESYHRHWKARADLAKTERDKWDKDGDKHGKEPETRLWYKFHGQHQAYTTAARHYAAAAANVYSRIADGETVL